VLFDQVAEAQPFIQLPHQQHAGVGTHARTLEINPQPTVERKLKGLFSPLTRANPPPHRPDLVEVRVHQDFSRILSS